MPAYAVVVRMAAKSAARIVALRRDDRIIEPSLLPVGKKLRFPPERGRQYSADIGFVQSDIRRERRFTLTPWTSRSTRSSRSGERCEECGAKLTEREIELALEAGGPNLCSVHRAEAVELDEPGDEPV